jgi:thioesterase domain-containing protein
LFDVEQPPPQHWESLLPIRPAGPRPPLFWVHGQASDPLLSQFLDRDQPLYGLIHQAHDGQLARHTTVETIAAHYLREIRTVRPQGPYRLGGFCFGAVVAFEMAQQLRQAGEPIEALVLVAPSPVRVDLRRQGSSDTTAPTSGPAPLTIRRRVIRAVRSRLSRDRWSTGWVRARVQFHSITGTELPLSLRSPYILDVYRRALARYRPFAYPDPITVFSESNADPVSIAAWSTLGADGSEFHRLDDEHDALLEQAAIRTWAVPMARDLDRRHHPDSSRARTLAT